MFREPVADDASGVDAGVPLLVVEILSPEHPAYRFAFLNRRLFEYDRFHITQTRFPYAYRFHPVGVRDKTPFARR